MYFIDILFTQYRPILLVHILRQYQIIYLSIDYSNIRDSTAHLLGGFHFTMGVLVYLFIDMCLQQQDDINKAKDIKVMKTIHDLKNPVTAMTQIINDTETLDKSISTVKDQVNSELEDLQDMLDNLRTEFKSKHGMEINEQARECQTTDFLKGIRRTQDRLAKNGRNNLIIQAENNFPDKIYIQKLNIKRVSNNLISNALKHTNGGSVVITLTIQNASEISSLDSEQTWFQIGNPVETQSKDDTRKLHNEQIMFEIKDNGKGIPKSKIKQIFDEKESDESEDNWDGTGMGLPICMQICGKIGAFIRYSSVEGIYTIFRLFVPQDRVTDKVVRQYSINSRLSDASEHQEHVCNAVQIAEDNPNILKKYEKVLTKNNIPQYTFLNGKDCQDCLANMKCVHCRKILVMTDLRMPQMNGIEMAKTLRKHTFNFKIRIVLVSAEDQSSKDEIFDHVQYKPLLPSILTGEYKSFCAEVIR